MYEIILTRIFSVTMWYHFAFVAISIALFGMTVGALIVHLLPQVFRDEDLPRRLTTFAALFALAIAVCFVTQLSIPFVPTHDAVGIWSVAATCAVISVPFVCSGVVVCLALTRFTTSVNRLYAVDLVGAAVGCILIVLLLARFDAPSAVFAIAAVAAVGALCFARHEGARPMALTAALVVALGAFTFANSALHDDGRPFLRIIWAKESRESLYDFEKWNAFSRVTVDGDPQQLRPPSGWGLSRTLPPDIRVRELQMAIDISAGTIITNYTGDPAETDFLRYDITNLAHYAVREGEVMVVGVGGGRDVLSALEFEQHSVTGVEINDNILEIVNDTYGDFTGHLDRDPRVTFVNDEARSYAARTDREFDLIQISLIDTFAASSAGAYALTENSLYTTEAWNIFFDSLASDGVLSVSRWYNIDGESPFEMYRLTALASTVLTDRGALNPREHILIYRAPDTYYAGTNVATMLVSPQPFRAETLATIDREAARLQFVPILTTDVSIDVRFAALASSEGREDAIDSFRYNIAPPTDNRPFFFQMANFEHFFDGGAWDDVYIVEPVQTIALLSFVVIALALTCIVAPLMLTTDRSAHHGMFPYYTYFAGIGFGFLLIEISLLQRLSIFLGHPTYALTVVLFSILLASGTGSMLSERIATAGRSLLVLAPLAALLAAIIAFGFITPGLITRFDGETTPVRIIVAIAILMPLGVLMGMPFAIGMRAASALPGAPTAFLWGINGATSVCASVLGMMIALLFGISAAFWTGAAAYTLATGSLAGIVLLPRWRDRPELTTAATQPTP